MVEPDTISRLHTRHTNAEILKRLFDLVVALILLIVLAPTLLLIAIAVKLDSQGPVLYRQNRLGLGARRIHVLKFRTMYVESDQAKHARYVEQLARGLQ